MKRWAFIRLMLRVGAAASLAAVPFVGGGIAAGVLAATAAALTTLSVDLPRDPWTPEQIEAHRRKTRRSTTRSNPITRNDDK